jgi:probable phosphoglycerate mutase
MTNLYLIRHGEATTQVSNVLRDEGLTPLGVKQAERLRDRLAGTGEIAADVLIASTLPRARQTAEIIAPAFNLPIIWDDEVQELRMGEAEGMELEEFREKFGGYKIEEYPFRPVATRGENWGQFVLRVAMALDRITREHAGKTIVIVCHGGVIDNSFVYFFGMNSLTLPEVRFYTYNTSITHWRKNVVSDEGQKERWRLIRYNDNLHIRDIDSPVSIPWAQLPKPARRGRRAPTETSAVAPIERE